MRPQGGQRLANDIEEKLHLHGKLPLSPRRQQGLIPVERSQIPFRHQPVLRFLSAFGSRGSRNSLTITAYPLSQLGRGLNPPVRSCFLGTHILRVRFSSPTARP